MYYLILILAEILRFYFYFLTKKGKFFRKPNNVGNCLMTNVIEQVNFYSIVRDRPLTFYLGGGMLIVSLFQKLYLTRKKYIRLYLYWT